MQEYKLTDRDYSKIRNLAEGYYIENNVKLKVKDHRNFLAYCYTKAFLRYCEHKDLLIEGNTVYEE